jgi:hypothetical protein
LLLIKPSLAFDCLSALASLASTSFYSFSDVLVVEPANPSDI